MAKKSRRKAAKKSTRKKTTRKKAPRKKSGRKKVAGRRKTSRRKKTTRRGGAARGRRKKAGRRAGRPSALSRVDTTDLRRELERRESSVAELKAERDRLATDLERIEAEIAELGGNTSGRRASAGAARPRRRAAGGRRPRNEAPLADALEAVLKGREMRVIDIVDAVQAAGYKTSAANFRTIVNATLGKDPRFKKISRGVYTV